MRVTLISPYPDLTAFGPRTLSAVLRREGVATRLVFLPDPLGDELKSGLRRYSPTLLGRAAELCRDADLIGISLMTNYFDNAVELTEAIRQAGVAAPILWGGVHPTIRPGECLAHADLACVGDGEETLLEICRRIEAGSDLDDVAGLWVRRDGRIIENPVRPLEPDLDRYPAPDWSHEEHFVGLGEDIAPLTPETTREFLSRGTVSRLLGRVGYQTMTGRGCPHRCAYCVNDAVKRLYGAKGYLRWRSTDHVMAEIEEARRIMPFIGLIWISDDAFFGRPLEDIRQFCRAYVERVGLPFSCLASPLTMSREKLDALMEAGLVYLQMGVQSGSARIQELFNRKAMNNDKMLEAMGLINAYKDRMLPPSYDFILDTPYETTADKLESVRFIARIPKPFRLQPFSLVLYPGTRLHEMALADGRLSDEKGQVYTKSYTMRQANYPNLLILLAKGGRFPAPLLAFLASEPVGGLLSSPALAPLVRGLFLFLRAAKRLAKKALGRP